MGREPVGRRNPCLEDPKGMLLPLMIALIMITLGLTTSGRVGAEESSRPAPTPSPGGTSTMTGATDPTGTTGTTGTAGTTGMPTQSGTSELMLTPDHPAVRRAKAARNQEEPQDAPNNPLILGLKILAGLVVLVIVLLVSLPILSGTLTIIQQAARGLRKRH